ncbi:MAG: Tetratricopeptide 2 repeat protein [Gemmatimonadetes bacterium]|nr:Tetratricopeptide 2 repeat protein [Gemmatimonadota bacterium]
MRPVDPVLPPPPDDGPCVIVLEAAPGRARHELLARWARDARAGGAAAAWSVSADLSRWGVWAGLNGWMKRLLPDVEARAPELVTRHDAELVAVVPALARRVTPRHVPLTEAATRDEVVRSYAPERAWRIGHGIVDLLDAWHAREGGGRWALAVDDFDRRGALVGRFFRDLLRRRGSTLRLALLVAVDPGAGQAAADELSPFARVVSVLAELPADPAPAPSPKEAARRVRTLEARIRREPDAAVDHLHEMAELWTAAGDPDRAATWHLAAIRHYNQAGWHEDAMRHTAPLEAALRSLGDGPLAASRWNMVVALYTTYQSCGFAERACELVRTEGVEKLARPEERARALYVMAMFQVRHLPVHDHDLGERYLREALAELERAEMPEVERHFMTVFILNGMALARVRQGQPDEAARMTHANHARLEENLPAGRHRLYRSVLLYNAAQVHARTGRYADAIAAYTAALEIDPDYSEYHNERGSAHLKAGMPAEAERDYRRAIEVAAPYPEVWFNLGQCLAAMHRFGEAEQAYARCLDLDPARHRARVGRAQSLAALGRRDEALAEYDAAVATDPSNPLVLANRAALRHAAGRIAESLDDLDSAVALAPANAALYRSRATALRGLARFDDEAADLEAFLRLAPQAKEGEAAAARLVELSALAQPA